MKQDKMADSGDNSETFLTALSEQHHQQQQQQQRQAAAGTKLTAAGRRSSYRESDTSHNSTLRTDCTLEDVDGFVSPPHCVDELLPPPPPPLLPADDDLPDDAFSHHGCYRLSQMIKLFLFIEFMVFF